eukprot:TRINITY_DN21391_c0_g1_i1.p1 TRINITY_DN21391_c0_g1~~TRINITY_DN21391_c0_g1_i1.p1  ORF type:complete len:151 (+),score=28.47 TRINITY_DN21391_c0_g1_i1:48-500(+)
MNGNERNRTQNKLEELSMDSPPPSPRESIDTATKQFRKNPNANKSPMKHRQPSGSTEDSDKSPSPALGQRMMHFIRDEGQNEEHEFLEQLTASPSVSSRDTSASGRRLDGPSVLRNLVTKEQPATKQDVLQTTLSVTRQQQRRHSVTRPT